MAPYRRACARFQRVRGGGNTAVWSTFKQVRRGRVGGYSAGRTGKDLSSVGAGGDAGEALEGVGGLENGGAATIIHSKVAQSCHRR